MKSQTAVIVITPFIPIIGGSGILEINSADPFDVFYAVFNRNDQSQRCALVEGEWLTVHFIAKYGLRMQHAFIIYAHIIATVWCYQPGEAHVGLILQIIMLDKIGKPHTGPMCNLAPAFNAFEVENDFCFW